MAEQAKPKVIHPGDTSSEANSPDQPDPTSGPTASGSELHNSNSSNNSSSPTNHLSRSGKALRTKPKLVIACVAVLLIVILGLVMLTHHKPSAVAYSGGQVSVNADSFFPKVISIKPGQQVTWTNYDSSPHWIASDPFPKDDGYAALNSGGALTHGDSYTITFSKAGTYTYHDNLNPFKLQGTVVVR